MPDFDRLLAVGALAATIATNTCGTAPVGQIDAIKSENDKPGATDWQLPSVEFDAKAKYRQSLGWPAGQTPPDRSQAARLRWPSRLRNSHTALTKCVEMP
jgi:hypothetical protein